MQLGKTLYVTDGIVWRSWLAKNHRKAKEIWLVYYRKSSRKARIPYNDAVEQALCFGWIDSIVKNIDDEKFAQRFSPRRPGSVLSQINKERIRKMISKGQMTPFGLRAVSHAFDHKREEKLTIPKAILTEIKANANAWKNFNKFSDAYKRVRVEYLKERRKYFGEKEYERSLANFIKKTAKNVKFGQFQD